jgi:hypothetical protein
MMQRICGLLLLLTMLLLLLLLLCHVIILSCPTSSMPAATMYDLYADVTNAC